MKLSGIIIEGFPYFKNELLKCEDILFEYKKINNLSPKNISIAFTENHTLVFYNSFLENILTEELDFSEFEKIIIDLYPKATLFSMIIDDIISFAGFSLSTDNKKIRVKATVEGEIFIDKGILISTESNIYDNFIAEFKKNEISYKSFKTKMEKLDETQFQKAILLLRDKIYEKNNSANDFNQTNGTLDNAVIESLISFFLNKTYFEIEDEINFYQLTKKKFNLLEDFKNCLHKSYEIHKNK